jgi:hypothetical protein
MRADSPPVERTPPSPACARPNETCAVEEPTVTTSPTTHSPSLRRVVGGTKHFACASASEMPARADNAAAHATITFIPPLKWTTTHTITCDEPVRPTPVPPLNRALRAPPPPPRNPCPSAKKKQKDPTLSEALPCVSVVSLAFHVRPRVVLSWSLTDGSKVHPAASRSSYCCERHQSNFRNRH